jgi:hypothetical protein
MTPLTEGVAGLHEMFVSLVEVGFSEVQAISLLAHFMYLQATDGGSGG